MNMFAYCNNNPVNFGDDGGGFAISLTAAAIGIGKLLFDLTATYIFVEAAWEVGKAVGNTVSDYSQNAKSKPKADAPSVPATGGSTPASPGGHGRGNKGNNNNSNWNWQRVNEKYLENKLRQQGTNPHQFKYEYLSANKPISRYDISVDKITSRLAIFEKATGKLVEITHYFIR